MKRILTAAAAMMMAGIMVFGLSACSINFNSDDKGRGNYSLDPGDIDLDEVKEFIENIDLNEITEALNNIDTDQIASDIEEKGEEVLGIITGLIKGVGESLSELSVLNETPSVTYDDDNDESQNSDKQNLISDFGEIYSREDEEDKNEALAMIKDILNAAGLGEYYSEIEAQLEKNPELAESLMENITFDDMLKLFSDSMGGMSSGEEAGSGNKGR